MGIYKKCPNGCGRSNLIYKRGKYTGKVKEGKMDWVHYADNRKVTHKWFPKKFTYCPMCGAKLETEEILTSKDHENMFKV